MLDTKQLGKRLSALRKQNGLSQEKLAEILSISSPAISKWENGHTMPETALLPALAQIFHCTIDDILMPDVDITENTNTALQKQAKHFAQPSIIGLDDTTIISAVKKCYPNLGNCKLDRNNTENHPRYTSLYITVTAPQMNIKLIEKIYHNFDSELSGYKLFNEYTSITPQVYYLDMDKNILLLEDLNENIQGFHFDEDNAQGILYRNNYAALMHETAKMHASFWENQQAFSRLGLDWRHQTKENLLMHINGMEKDFLKYRKNEEAGEIPKHWNGLTNTITSHQLDYFESAITVLKETYPQLLEERFSMGKGITIIHGDLHPGNTFLLASSHSTFKFIDLEAVRIGLCTEDLAMLLALHIEPDKERAQSLLNNYYEYLCTYVNNYSYDVFMNDYKLAVMEAMFFTIRLINNGIYDFSMRDKAIIAYETFVLKNT